MPHPHLQETINAPPALVFVGTLPTKTELAFHSLPPLSQSPRHDLLVVLVGSTTAKTRHPQTRRSSLHPSSFHHHPNNPPHARRAPLAARQQGPLVSLRLPRHHQQPFTRHAPSALGSRNLIAHQRRPSFLMGCWSMGVFGPNYQTINKATKPPHIHPLYTHSLFTTFPLLPLVGQLVGWSLELFGVT
jgi:hypothetical protein